jgi:prepilin-type N-terminal cleavage/methylation domain-containing protein
MKQQKSFTLIEILVVIVVIGVLSAFILVGMSSITNNANIARSQAFVNSLNNALLLSMVSQWKLDGNLNDSWGTNIGVWNGVAGGNNTAINYRSSSECVSGQCLDFDGTDDYVDYGDILRPSRTSNRTFSFWVNPRVITGIVYGTGNLWQSASGYSEFALASSTTINISYDLLNSPYRTTFNCVIDQSKWNYFTVSFDSVSDSANVIISLYKNGNFIASQTLARRTSGGYNVAFILGAVSSAADNHKVSFLNGQIDDFRVYDALVSSYKIRQNYYLGLNNLLLNNNICVTEYTNWLAEAK